MDFSVNRTSGIPYHIQVRNVLREHLQAGTWQPGDRFLQLARLPLPADLPPGDYTLQFGLYDRATGARWPVLNADGRPAGDRLLLPPQALGR